jgi:hypothetical protein
MNPVPKCNPLRGLPTAVAAAITVFCAFVVSGCHLFSPGSASFASVTITNRSPAEIGVAVGQVFQEDGYTLRTSKDGQWVFEKEGTRANDLAYNGLVATHNGSRTAVRVRMDLVELGNDSRRLQCQAYMVRNAGEAFFEDESRVANIRSGPYQSLLDKVAERLNPPAK